MCTGSTPWRDLAKIAKISSIPTEQFERFIKGNYKDIKLDFTPEQWEEVRIIHFTESCSFTVPFHCLENGERYVEVYMSGYPEVSSALCKKCSRCKELIKMQDEKTI